MKRFCIVTFVMASIVPVVSHAAIKLGYIDSDIVKDRLPEFREAQRKLDQLRQDYEREAGDRQGKLLKLQEDFRKQELLMSEDRRQELQDEFDAKVQHLQSFNVQKFGPEGELVRKNVELSGPIFKQINDALQAIGREDGYDFIFDVAGNSSIIFVAEDKYNLTEDVLKRLGEEREEREKGK